MSAHTVAELRYQQTESAYHQASNRKQWQAHVTKEVQFMSLKESDWANQREWAGSGGAHMSCQTGLSFAAFKPIHTFSSAGQHCVHWG